MNKYLPDKHYEKIEIKNLAVNLLYQKEMNASRIFLSISFLLSFMLLLYSSIEFSCQLSFIQNIIFPFLISQNIQSCYASEALFDKIKLGFIAGIITGVIPATTIIFVSSFKNRDITYSYLGGNSSLSILETLYTVIGTLVVTWLFLVFFSIIASVMGVLVGKRKKIS